MKFNVGDKVRFLNKKEHIEHPWCYPEVGTVGVVLNAEEANKEILVDWGKDSGCDNNDYYYDKCAWWCLKTLVEKVVDYTNDEVWDMLKPKMKQFALDFIDIECYPRSFKNMIVAAYRSGYGRATKGRPFMIKPKVKDKPSITKQIDAVLGGKTLVTFYDTDDSYAVSNFEYSAEGKQGIEIHDKPIYDSGECGLFSGYDVIGEPDCEIYVAVPFSEIAHDFDSKTLPKVKAIFCGKKSSVLSHIKKWAIGKYNGTLQFGNRKRVSLDFSHEKGILSRYIDVYSPDFKALVPICDYFKYNGVNV